MVLITKHAGHTPLQCLEFLAMLQALIKDVNMQYILFQMDGCSARKKADQPDKDHFGHRVSKIQLVGDEPTL